jgi:hypothetical protein
VAPTSAAAVGQLLVWIPSSGQRRLERGRMKKGENPGMGISDTTIFILQIHLDVLLELLQFPFLLQNEDAA